MMLGMGRKRSSWERQSKPWAKRWNSTGELALPLSSYLCKFVSGNNKKLSKKLSNFQSFGPKSEKVGEFTFLCTMSNAMFFLQFQPNFLASILDFNSLSNDDCLLTKFGQHKHLLQCFEVVYLFFKKKTILNFFRFWFSPSVADDGNYLFYLSA